ncbi:hypothetical protein BDW74DRAFT_146829 [Aspergillus multicolor]|uniref:uncharacterized protein n=1 Tax=Aspergillus multicolor TaxID=41759 RepID=UPI003CCD8EE1
MATARARGWVLLGPVGGRRGPEWSVGRGPLGKGTRTYVRGTSARFPTCGRFCGRARRGLRLGLGLGVCARGSALWDQVWWLGSGFNFGWVRVLWAD